MSDVGTLVAFLREQLDRMERAASAAQGLSRPWYFDMIDDDAREFVDLALDPDGVLADIDAKRRMLDEHPHVPAAPWGSTEVTSVGCQVCSGNGQGVIGDGWCKTVRLLALPYADRPGYQEAWRP